MQTPVRSYRTGENLIGEPFDPRVRPMLRQVDNFLKDPPKVGHPGFAESMIPVWGSGREAMMDAQEGRMAEAFGNLAMAGLEAVPMGTVTGLGVKGVLRAKKGSQTWDAHRKVMARKKVIRKGNHGHHSIVPQGRWGKKIPPEVKHHNLNIKELTPENHGRVHGSYKGKPKFDPARRYWYGTPEWFKAVHGMAAGNLIGWADQHTGDRR